VVRLTAERMRARVGFLKAPFITVNSSVACDGAALANSTSPTVPRAEASALGRSRSFGPDRWGRPRAIGPTNPSTRRLADGGQEMPSEIPFAPRHGSGPSWTWSCRERCSHASHDSHRREEAAGRCGLKAALRSLATRRPRRARFTIGSRKEASHPSG
jgi:hypothetical protein